ncbi:hypothetical protein I4U23_011737 [Adineta vaga]|nr:hypothetical protein I4U23_011737 [Adineta vaga]
MTQCFIRYTFFIIFIASMIQPIESIRCSKECSFHDIPLNSSAPADFCSSLNGGFVSNLTIDLINIFTIFSLNDTSTKVIFDYICSVSDYCDIEFARETFLSAMVAPQMERLRQKLVSVLYDPNNTEPIRCFNDSICSQNSSFCFVEYVHTSYYYTRFNSTCQNPDDFPKLEWTQSYSLHNKVPKPDILGSYYCNTPNCAENTTVTEIFQMLAREYPLHINVSFITTTTTFTPTSQFTTQITTTTTTNHASFLLGNSPNIMVFMFLFAMYNFF